MLQQYLRAYNNEDDPANYLYFLLKEMSEPPADDDPYAGEDKCHKTNHNYRGNYGDIKKGESEANSKGINACRNGEYKEDIYAQYFNLPLSLFNLPGLIDHLGANSAQQ